MSRRSRSCCCCCGVTVKGRGVSTICAQLAHRRLERAADMKHERSAACASSRGMGIIPHGVKLRTKRAHAASLVASAAPLEVRFAAPQARSAARNAARSVDSAARGARRSGVSERLDKHLILHVHAGAKQTESEGGRAACSFGGAARDPLRNVGCTARLSKPTMNPQQPRV